METTGTIANGSVILDAHCGIPDGTKVTVRIVPATEAKEEPAQSTLGKRLLKHAGTVEDLPTDLAEQHDHYLHGTPKR